MYKYFYGTYVYGLSLPRLLLWSIYVSYYTSFDQTPILHRTHIYSIINKCFVYLSACVDVSLYILAHTRVEHIVNLETFFVFKRIYQCFRPIYDNVFSCVCHIYHSHTHSMVYICFIIFIHVWREFIYEVYMVLLCVSPCTNIHSMKPLCVFEIEWNMNVSCRGTQESDMLIAEIHMCCMHGLVNSPNLSLHTQLYDYAIYLSHFI